MTPVEAVQQAQSTWLMALHQGDVATLMRLNQAGGNSFYLDNALLFPDPDQSAWESAYESGLQYRIQPHHEETRVFGQCAVITGYFSGTVITPGGGSQSGTWRSSSMWVQTDGEWRNQHVHLSPLAPNHTSN